MGVGVFVGIGVGVGGMGVGVFVESTAKLVFSPSALPILAAIPNTTSSCMDRINIRKRALRVLEDLRRDISIGVFPFASIQFDLQTLLNVRSTLPYGGTYLKIDRFAFFHPCMLVTHKHLNMRSRCSAHIRYI
jgi:hypothetical protein